MKTKTLRSPLPMALDDHDLTFVSGGSAPALGEIVVSTPIDASSPKLFEGCSTGKHFKKVSLEIL
jgi:type VI protein secretion system component Hcp